MSPRKTLAAALATALIAAPAASAMPIDPVGDNAKDPRQLDMHASTVHKPSQDLRGESAADGGTVVVVPKKLDLRGESAATGGTGANHGLAIQPAPTWPAYPTPLPLPHTTAPVAVSGDSDDGFPVELLIIGGLAALTAGMGVVAMRGRARPAL